MNGKLKTQSQTYGQLLAEKIDQYGHIFMGIIFVWAISGVFINASGIIHIEITETPVMNWFERESGRTLGQVHIVYWYLQFLFYVAMAYVSGKYIVAGWRNE